MTSSREAAFERRYEVDQAAILPTLTEVDGVVAVGQPVESTSETVYFDTADLALARQGATLRRRVGGHDVGWHLNLPRPGDDRTELHLPLEHAVETVPARLLGPVRAVVRDGPLVPVARVNTRRVERALVGDDKVALAQVCDEQIRAVRLVCAVQEQAWREWAVELFDGARSLLDAVEERLLTAGASRARASSTLARVLGEATPPAPRRPSRKALARGSTSELVRSHLAEHIGQLHTQDEGVRGDRPEAVHKMRIAARRLRCALTTYQTLFQPGTVDPVRQELRWLGQTLGEARDAQVLGQHLDRRVASEPIELVLGPVARRIDDEWRTAYRAGRQNALDALDSERYFRLLDALDRLVKAPSLTPRADIAAKDLVPRLVQGDAKRLRRAVREVERAHDPLERDLALHEARKKTKRLRYAAESAVPVSGARARDLAVAAKQVQEALGQHQDAVLARQKLREYGIQAHLSGENGFTFGRLHALEQWRADQAEREFTRAWARLSRKRRRRWLQR